MIIFKQSINKLLLDKICNCFRIKNLPTFCILAFVYIMIRVLLDFEAKCSKSGRNSHFFHALFSFSVFGMYKSGKKLNNQNKGKNRDDFWFILVELHMEIFKFGLKNLIQILFEFKILFRKHFHAKSRNWFISIRSCLCCDFALISRKAFFVQIYPYFGVFHQISNFSSKWAIVVQQKSRKVNQNIWYVIKWGHFEKIIDFFVWFASSTQN